jgi:YVTN family beta-propeller protein
MRASLIVYEPGLRSGAKLPLARMIDLAPSAAVGWEVQGNRPTSGFVFIFVILYAGSAQFTTNDQSQRSTGKFHGQATMKTISLSLAIFAFLLISPACKSGANLPARKPPVTVYVTNEASGDMSVIDAANNEVIATLPLGKRPRGIQITPDKKNIFVALSGSPIAGPGVDEDSLPPPDKTADGIGIVDIDRNAFLKLMPVGSDPEQFAISRDGAKLYVSNEDVGLASMVDLSNSQVLKSLPVGKEPEGVSISPDGKTVYVTSENDGTVSVIDANDFTLLTTLKVGRRPRVVAFLPDGSRAYVSLENDRKVVVIDPAKAAVLRDIVFEGDGVKPMGIAAAPDGKKIYVTTGRFGKVFVVDTATEQVVGTIDVGGRPWGIAITPDGKTLYTANGPANDVSVVDVATLKVTNKIKVGDRPWGVAILTR